MDFFKKTIVALIANLTDDAVRHDQYTLWQAKSHIFATLGTSLLMWGYTILAWQTINHSVPWIVGSIFSLIHLLSIILLKWPGNISLATNVMLGSGMIHQGVFGYFSGAYLSPILIWFGILPMIAGVINGRKGTITWSSISLLVSLIFLYQHLSGQYSDNYISADGIIIGQSFMLFGWIFLSTGLIYIYNRYRDNQLQLLDEEKKCSEMLIKVLCHDISNPLMNIQLRIGLLSKELKLQDNQNMQKINKSAAVINNMIKEVRTWQSSLSNKYLLNTEAFEFNDIVDLLKNEFESKLELKSLNLKFSTTVNSPAKIIADKNVLFSQVMSNLISNAIKFSPHHSTINIKHEISRQVAFISIRDEGIGMPQELISKVFSINEATSRVGTSGETGTGFGLPIVKSFVEAMQGKIEVKSQIIDKVQSSSWTEFKVTLPAEEIH